MPGSRALFRSIALGTVLLSTACAVWFVPQSRSRGHLFDEVSRGAPQFGPGVVQQVLDFRLRRDFPPGTPLSELMPHIEGADVTCSGAIEDRADPGRKITVCRYESLAYQAFAFMGMGEPLLFVADNRVTLAIFHSVGLIDDYDIMESTTFTDLEREEYRERLARQREEEERQLRNLEDQRNE